MPLNARTRILVAAASACPALLGHTSPASADTAYHDVEYTVESSSGDGAMTVRYTVDPHDHTDPSEKHFAQDVVDLPWSASARVGEADYKGGKPVPDSKPFQGLDLGLTVTTADTTLSDGLMDNSGKLNGPAALDAWSGGKSFQTFYTCRITVDGQVVAEQTAKGLCSAQYKHRGGKAS